MQLMVCSLASSGLQSSRYGFSDSVFSFNGNAIVLHLIRNGEWVFPPKNSFVASTWMKIEAKSSVRLTLKTTRFVIRVIGGFSVKSALLVIPSTRATVHWAKVIWDKAVMPRHGIIAWRSLHRKLTAHEFLSSRDRLIVSRFVLWDENEETPNHLFYSCSYLKWLWVVATLRLGWRTDIEEVLQLIA